MPPSKSADPKQPIAGTSPGRPEPPPELREGYVAVGVVLTSFGLKGDIKVEPLTDFPRRFAPGESVWLAGHKRRIQRSRSQGAFVYVKLAGIASSEAVAELRGYLLEIPEEELAALPPGDFYRSDLIGLTVVTAAGDELGSVDELMPTGANDVLVVRGDRGEALIPMIEDVVLSVDLDARRITIEPVEGLLPEPRAERPPRMPPPGKHWRPARRRPSKQSKRD